MSSSIHSHLNKQQTILFEIQEILNNRRLNWQEQKDSTPTHTNSYVEQLYQKGLNQMGKKVIEEAGEVLMAAKDCAYKKSDNNQQELVNEITDLWFHCMVLLTYYEGDITQVMDEAIKRFGTSGLAEKKVRSS